MWYEYLYRVLSIINYIAIGFFGIPLLLQFIEVFAAFFHKRIDFKKSDKQARIAYVIPAYNESSVIKSTVEDVIKSQKYPRDKFDVYVVADNCTDNTADLAREAGAIVLIHNDPDPAHHMAAYPLKYGIDYILKNDKDAELVIHLDADNHINPEYSQLMNDAYQSGVDFARPYEGAINGNQNFFTKACAFFYAFDSRFGGRGKEVLGLSARVNGSGATMSRRMLEETNGYDSVTISDDTEFTMNRLIEGRKAHFVEAAVVYEDMPSTGADTNARNTRIGKGMKILFKLKAKLMLKSFFKKGNFSALEALLSYCWLFIGLPMFLWIFFYYTYMFVFAAFAANGAFELTLFSTEYFATTIKVYVWAFIILAVFAYFIFGIVITCIFAFGEFKKFGAKSRKEFLPMVFIFPVYLFVYALSIGVHMNKKKGSGWKQIKRNVKEDGK